MTVIGLYTHDFSVFYDLVRLLKERDVEFFSLREGKVPPWIDVVIVTEDTREEVEFDHVIVADEATVGSAVEEAVLFIERDPGFHMLVIGIDPGERPGMAVYGDRELLTTAKMEFPEDAAAMVKRIKDIYASDNVVVRIGHGAPTYRNRIINVLLPLQVRIEIVDERSTTFQHRTPDIQAAIQIGLKKGRNVTRELEVVPSKGEIEDIKRRSRIMSQGRFTISHARAEAVARGESTLKTEVDQRGLELFGMNTHERRNTEKDEEEQGDGYGGDGLMQGEG